MPNRVIGLDLSIQVGHHVKGKRVVCGLYIIVYSLTLFTAIVIVQISGQQCPYALRHQECCADSTLELKSITINKRKLNNKHTQRTQELHGSANCLPPQRRRRYFTIKIRRYNSAQEQSQEIQIPINPNSLSPTRQENNILLLMRLLLGY